MSDTVADQFADTEATKPRARPRPRRPRLPPWRDPVVHFWLTACVLLLLLAPLVVVPRHGTITLATDLPALQAAWLPALLATALAALLGLPAGAALWWYRLGERPQLLAPFLAPLLVRGLDSALGLPPVAALLVQGMMLVPLVAVGLLATLGRLHPTALHGAIANGATPALLLTRLVLPLAVPGALAALLLGWLLLLDGATGVVAPWLQAVALAVLATATMPWPERR